MERSQVALRILHAGVVGGSWSLPNAEIRAEA